MRIGNFVSDNAEYIKADFKIISMAQNYQPILLTFEILEKLGFVASLIPGTNNLFQMTVNHDILFIALNKGVAFFSQQCLDEAAGGIPCKYVHQLQNIFYVVRGWEELTDKMKELLYATQKTL